MLNKEKYVKEIFDIVCETGSSPAIINNAPIKCDDAQCSECKLYYCDSCARGFTEWANSEYKEPEIDWDKVPVDTPIYVWDSCYKNKTPRHFASFKNNTNTIVAFNNGQTSWTVDDNEYDVSCWKHAEIKEGVDCSEWYKD